MTIRDSELDLRQQNELLNRLLDVSLILNSNLALNSLLSFIMDATCEITHSEAASILLYNRNSDELRFVASNSPGTDQSTMAEIPVPMEGSIAGQIVRENRAIVIQDPADPRIYRGVDDNIGFHTRTLLGVPMRIKEDVVGVLESVNKREGLWTEDDRNYLSILAAQAAVAVENARQAAALKQAYNDVSQLDKLKNDFISIASHELRTPLGIILGYASFLKEEAQGEASDHAAAVLNSAMHMRDVIEAMTNLRYLQSGQVDLVTENVTVGTLVQTAVHDVQSMMTAKGHHLSMPAADDKTLVSVDRLKIGMALTNILNNAVKFTPNGGQITVTVEHRPHEVQISVADSGIGIPAEQLETIFVEFFQVADHMTRSQNGMGLGLSIAKRLVEAHHGRLWAESAGSHKGSTFFMALPLAQS